MTNNTILLEFDFECEQIKKISLSLSKKSVFLIGCYLSKYLQNYLI